MITFQFDQCFNDKKLARDCTNQGLSVAWCFPKRLIGEEDPTVLSDLLAKPNPLVTFDLRMAEDHTTYIPERNPGMVVISNGRGQNPRTMTTPIARRILQNFKGLIPQWHQSLLNNSIVEISPAGVEVWHVEAGRLVRDGYLAFTDADWSARLLDTLQQNARRGSSLPGPA
jgi:hypothetical protein